MPINRVVWYNVLLVFLLSREVSKIMIKVIETFSGIGSQAKALKNINIEHEIVATVEWDINAIYAYDIIHHGKQDLSSYMNFSKDELVEKLSTYTLSNDGKKPLTYVALRAMSEEALRKILCAIDRSKNLINIKDVKGKDLPSQVDLLTYSFPCQDLSICGFWKGNTSGIDRKADNRSGLLWEIERILIERSIEKLALPKFLLMENVSNILSDTHKENFKEWKDFLEGLGYINKVYDLNAYDLGVPQKRKRVYMLSILCIDDIHREKINKYLLGNNLNNLKIPVKPLEKYLRIDTSINEQYKVEADESQPNDTPSRKKILEDNVVIYKDGRILVDAVNTITTKQDRHPNSGIIICDDNKLGKASYRNLTPRECFLLMGFEESDFQILLDNNFDIRKGKKFLTNSKLIRMAGNSIVVDILELIFKQIEDIKNIQ